MDDIFDAIYASWSTLGVYLSCYINVFFLAFHFLNINISNNHNEFRFAILEICHANMQVNWVVQEVTTEHMKIPTNVQLVVLWNRIHNSSRNNNNNNRIHLTKQKQKFCCTFYGCTQNHDLIVFNKDTNKYEHFKLDNTWRTCFM